jgi:hypothetical protein
VFHISSYTGEGIRDVIAYLDDGTDEKLSPEHADRAESTFPERNTVSHE